MKPAQYWRSSKKIKDYLGKVGTVQVATMIRVSAPEYSNFTPYSYVIVDFDGVKKELMGVGNEELKSGDKVVCVMRKLSHQDDRSLIEYGLKVEKLKD